ncbi:MAG: sugar ABC transporter permease [Nocardioidaceae bacterium]|nr:sugar ABC transporter permease [Nocardioidaceae bacterium]MCL2613054.1 sugar ABC transporter permease [Nocardioidaceae bacterium]
MSDHTKTAVGGTATAVPPAAADPARERARLVRRQRRSRWDIKLSPYLYVSPFFILFLIVGLYPLVYTGFLSLFGWDRWAYHRGGFLGLDNYRFVLTDPIFLKSLVNTFTIFLMSSVPQVVIAVAVAALLDTRLRFRTFWRMSVLLPFVVAPTAVVLIFGSLFADQSGLINQCLASLNAHGLHFIHPVPWHSNRWASQLAISGMVNWRWTGYNTLIFLAAMQAVPRDLYESAAIDGAGRVRQFFSVTLPMIRPTMIFIIITSTIGGLQIFTEPRLFDDTVAREGGANHEYMTTTLYIYVRGIKEQMYGRASAAAWLLFMIIVAIALLNFGITRFLTRRSAA